MRQSPKTADRTVGLVQRMRWTAFALVLVVLLPAMSVGGGIAANAQAATGCEGEVVNTEWNQTVQRHALVPFSSWGMPYYAYEDDVRSPDDDGFGEDEESGKILGDWDEALHPEEPWMYSPTWPLPTLTPFTEGHYITMQVGNDSAGALRLNLSSTHRTTFCVNLYSVSDGETQPVDADVYLMTSSQYTRYEEVYRMIHGGWWWDDIDLAGGDNNLLSDIPPEWRSFNPLGWQSYRDVHQYEARSEVTFSVTMDAPEVYTSLFGNDEWQDFYLVIDAWDNTHDNDAGASGEVVVADVTVLSEPRNAMFPTWTVPLVLFALLAAVFIVPLILNKRYHNAGLGYDGREETTSVPYLEQSPPEAKNG